MCENCKSEHSSIDARLKCAYLAAAQIMDAASQLGSDISVTSVAIALGGLCWAAKINPEEVFDTIKESYRNSEEALSKMMGLLPPDLRILLSGCEFKKEAVKTDPGDADPA